MKLPSNGAIQRIIKAAKEAGVHIEAVDITTNGITIYSHPKGKTGTAFDRWKDEHSKARPSHR